MPTQLTLLRGKCKHTLHEAVLSKDTVCDPTFRQLQLPIENISGWDMTFKTIGQVASRFLFGRMTTTNTHMHRY